MTALKEQALMLPGDVLLVSSFISYLGCFTKPYRVELMDKKWLPYLKKVHMVNSLYLEDKGKARVCSTNTVVRRTLGMLLEIHKTKLLQLFSHHAIYQYV